jgi:hypothetical protein
VFWKDRIFSPLVTLWVFLGQVLSADSSCRAAVARLIAHLVSQEQRPCSAKTGAYCEARKRLPEKFFSTVACSVGRTLDAQADHRWLWKVRRVYVFDGTTVTMPNKGNLDAVLAYNLIRTLMAQAMAIHDLVPRSISFKGAMQTLEAFQPVIEYQSAQGTAHRLWIYQDLLRAITTHRVADRPDRFEPRAKKRRRNHYEWLTRPRSEYKRIMEKGVTEI